jgi:hypothetical protein
MLRKPSLRSLTIAVAAAAFAVPAFASPESKAMYQALAADLMSFLSRPFRWKAKQTIGMSFRKAVERYLKGREGLRAAFNKVMLHA